MYVFRSWDRRSLEGVVHRAAAAVVAVLCTLAFAVGLSAPAGAAVGRTGAFFGPHDPGVTPHASVRAHDVAALTVANIVVTDLSTNKATVYSTSSVSPNTGCLQNQTFICLKLGDAGGFMLTVRSPLQAGQVYSDLMGLATVTVNGASCGEFGDPEPASVFDVELDQYHPTPASPVPYDTFGAQFDCTNPAFDISGTIAYNIVPTDPQDGYYIFGQQGELTGFGNDNYLSYLNGAQYYNLNAPIVGMAPTPDGAGYWMVGSDGGVFASGNAAFYGSTGNLRLNKPVVGMATTADGGGYWFVASDGGIFAYGDAQFYGSTGNLHLNKPIVGMTSTPDGGGYWLVASDGGLFAYGDAQFYGSTGNIHLNKPIVGMASTPDGGGYWLVASDGGIFAYGDAQFYGSTGNLHLNKPIVGMAAAPDGGGYWFVASDGGLFNYGSAAFAGSLGDAGVTDAAGMSLGL
jgi:hypothetical protein